MRLELEGLISCPICRQRMFFKGEKSKERFVHGHFKCANGHFYQVKREIGLLKDAMSSANEFEWRIDVADEKRYDQVREQYDLLLGEERKTALNRMREAMVRIIMRSSAKSDHPVLDVATGLGTFILPLARESEGDLHIVGTDVDEKPLRGTLAKAMRTGVYGKIVVCCDRR